MESCSFSSESNLNTLDVTTLPSAGYLREEVLWSVVFVCSLVGSFVHWCVR